MFKTALLLLLNFSLLIADSFNFTELRYSDALGSSTQFQGKISFLEDGLNIYYPKNAKSLEYKNDTLTYKENDKKIDLDEIQSQQIMRYFDILILLHGGDESSFDEMFEVSKNLDMTILKPTGMIKNYIDTIELLKENKQLIYVKLFLKNNDYITINIDDEI